MLQYEAFIAWLEGEIKTGKINMSDYDCDECGNVCERCLNNLVGLEEDICRESVEDVFANRVRGYMDYSIQEQLLEPTSALDGYLTVIYLKYLRL